MHLFVEVLTFAVKSQARYRLSSVVKLIRLNRARFQVTANVLHVTCERGKHKQA